MHVLPHLVLLHSVFLLINRRKMITIKIVTPATIAIIALVPSFDGAVVGIDELVAGDVITPYVCSRLQCMVSQMMMTI